MTSLTIALPVLLPAMFGKPMPVQFAKSVIGENVTISIDGGRPRATFAGKLGFRNSEREWLSVCANVRAPITPGQRFNLLPLSSRKFGGGIKLAGNIVARYFNSAKSGDQCAGLQIAVWEAIEDGGWNPDFGAGHFRVKATAAAMAFASEYYMGLGEDGDAIFLQTDGGGQGSGGGDGQGQLSSTT